MKRGLTWLRNAWPQAGAVARVHKAYGLLKGPKGQALLSDLATYCNMGRASFVPGAPDVTAFHEGQRDVFLHIKELCGLSDEEVEAALTSKESSHGNEPYDAL